MNARVKLRMGIMLRNVALPYPALPCLTPPSPAKPRHATPSHAKPGLPHIINYPVEMSIAVGVSETANCVADAINASGILNSHTLPESRHALAKALQCGGNPLSSRGLGLPSGKLIKLFE